jgi:A/G-specific adenine glycosylase
MTRDPWAVLVSEVMLQQTQVSRVEQRWGPFLTAYPGPAALAEAPLADVLAHWQGLGYPRRAKALRDLAVDVVERHDGRLPADRAALLALPGVGPYTARAVLAFAFEADGHGVLDTNTARVLARAVRGRRLAAREAQTLADAMVPTGEAWRWNQAMLDLGALHCTKRSPRCAGCPAERACRWRADGGEDPALGSAGVSVRQAAFEGSDRQARGRLLAALQRSAMSASDAAEAIGVEPDRAARLLDGLVGDGLAARAGAASYSLPGATVSRAAPT